MTPSIILFLSHPQCFELRLAFIFDGQGGVFRQVWSALKEDPLTLKPQSAQVESHNIQLPACSSPPNSIIRTVQSSTALTLSDP
jgi:hypothetical protein